MDLAQHPARLTRVWWTPLVASAICVAGCGSDDSDSSGVLWYDVAAVVETTDAACAETPTLPTEVYQGETCDFVMPPAVDAGSGTPVCLWLSGFDRHDTVQDARWVRGRIGEADWEIVANGVAVRGDALRLSITVGACVYEGPYAFRENLGG